MRVVAALAVCLASGCGRTPAPQADSPAPAPSADVEMQPVPRPAAATASLYTDEEIRKLAKFDIDKASRDKPFMEIPCLEVVPSGESRPRGCRLGIIAV